MPMLDVYKKFSGWALGAYCLTAFSFPPAGVILGASILIKPYTTTQNLSDLFNTEKLYELPSWINECS